MSVQDVIRAWKDADYRESLSEADRARMPAHPAGLVELTDADLGNAAGGGDTNIFDCQSDYTCTKVIDCFSLRGTLPCSACC